MPWSARRAKACRALRSSTPSAPSEATTVDVHAAPPFGRTSSPRIVSSCALALEPARGRISRGASDRADAVMSLDAIPRHVTASGCDDRYREAYRAVSKSAYIWNAAGGQQAGAPREAGADVEVMAGVFDARVEVRERHSLHCDALWRHCLQCSP